MVSVKDLSEEQVEAIKAAVSSGAQLGDLQKLLNEELSVKATYLDTRFLVLDLGLEIANPEEAKPEEEAVSPTPTEETQVNEAPAEPTLGGGLNVTLDQVTQTGMMYNGNVVFSDGEKARWFIDNAGRPGIDPETEGYQPSPEDIQLFQNELRQLLSRG